MSDVVIIDSGGANIASLLFAFERLQANAVLSADAETIKNARRVLLPGVGAAKDAMQRLADAGLKDVIRSLTQPVLGICLGMQLLAEASEEEDTECLGIIPGTARRLQPAAGFPVPNMGWCATHKTTDHPLLNDFDDGSYYYYVHSYALPISEFTLAAASHVDEFAAIVGYKNFVAAQFHPERSSAAGAKLLRNFLQAGI